MIIFDNFDKLSISINEVLVPLFNVWRKQWFYNIYGGLTLMVDVCKQVGKILLETSQRKRISFTTCIKNYFILNMKFNTPPPFSHVHCLKWFSLTFFFFFFLSLTVFYCQQLAWNPCFCIIIIVYFLNSACNFMRSYIFQNEVFLIRLRE